MGSAKKALRKTNDQVKEILKVKYGIQTKTRSSSKTGSVFSPTAAKYRVTAPVTKNHGSKRKKDVEKRELLKVTSSKAAKGSCANVILTFNFEGGKEYDVDARTAKTIDILRRDGKWENVYTQGKRRTCTRRLAAEDRVLRDLIRDQHLR